jgi:hypothetical protein
MLGEGLQWVMNATNLIGLSALIGSCRWATSCQKKAFRQGGRWLPTG